MCVCLCMYHLSPHNAPRILIQTPFLSHTLILSHLLFPLTPTLPSHTYSSLFPTLLPLLSTLVPLLHIPHTHSHTPLPSHILSVLTLYTFRSCIFLSLTYTP